MAWDLRLPDEAATLALGRALAAGIGPGRVLHLRGELGTGKTTLVRGCLRALGESGRIKSPTYSLVELYSISSLNLYHFDFYRFNDKNEWLSAGFGELFGPDSACIVEWPERAGDLLPRPDVDVHLAIEGDGRRAVLTSCSEAGAAWLRLARSRYSAP